MELKVGKKICFSLKKSPVIIAEVSANHCGSKKKFINHIKLAHKNGADLVKIQTYEPQDITLKTKNKKFKIKAGLWKNKYLWDLYKRAQTPFKWHYDAFKIAKKLGITLFSTPFSTRAVDFLESLNVKLYKIASLENTDLNLVDRIAKTKKPIIVSTGASSFKEVKECIKTINRYHNKVIILHCVSEYPTPQDQANLSRIIKLRKIFKNNLIGLSDHTTTIDTALASVPLGIVAIEKHFKNSNKNKSEDAKFSITPKELFELKKKSIIYYNSTKPNTSESNKGDKKATKHKRSIYSKKNILKNEKINKNNIVALRPKIGIESNKFFKIVGKRARKKIKINEPIFMKDLR